jgi:hypothetical protein
MNLEKLHDSKIFKIIIFIVVLLLSILLSSCVNEPEPFERLGGTYTGETTIRKYELSLNIGNSTHSYETIITGMIEDISMNIEIEPKVKGDYIEYSFGIITTSGKAFWTSFRYNIRFNNVTQIKGYCVQTYNGFYQIPNTYDQFTLIKRG